MTAGPLRKRATIQTRGRTADGLGGWTTGWTNAKTLWARLQPQGGGERLRAEAKHDERRYLLRYRALAYPGLDSTMRVLVGGVVYAVESVENPDERGDWLEAVVTREAAAEA